jgi:hypothetical protein
MLCRNSQRVSSEVSKIRGSGAPRKMLEMELFLFLCNLLHAEESRKYQGIINVP